METACLFGETRAGDKAPIAFEVLNALRRADGDSGLVLLRWFSKFFLLAAGDAMLGGPVNTPVPVLAEERRRPGLGDIIFSIFSLSASVVGLEDFGICVELDQLPGANVGGGNVRLRAEVAVGGPSWAFNSGELLRSGLWVKKPIV